MTNEKLLPQAIPTTILKNDARGRVLTPPEEREALLDAFESQNELSAPKFAEQRGINYQTFATWRQKRRNRLEILYFDGTGFHKNPVDK